MSRRIGVDRTAGFRGIGGGVPYTPLAEPTLLAWWDPTTLAAGAVTSWVDRKSGWSLGQSTALQKPTYATNAFTAPDGRTFPGVSFAGGQILSCASGFGAAIDPLSTLTMMCSAQDTTPSGTAAIVIEYTANGGTTNGGFWLAVNDGGVGDSVEWTLRGFGGSGTWQSAANSVSLTDPGVLATRYDFSQLTGQTVRELDNWALLGAPFASGCGADTFALDTLYVGARSGLVAPWTGVLGDLIFLTGAADKAARTRVARFMAPRIGSVAA